MSGLSARLRHRPDVSPWACGLGSASEGGGLLFFQGYRYVLGFKGLSRMNGYLPAARVPSINSTVPLILARAPVQGWQAISPVIRSFI